MHIYLYLIVKYLISSCQLVFKTNEFQILSFILSSVEIPRFYLLLPAYYIYIVYSI